jgi:hypothetical protein
MSAYPRAVGRIGPSVSCPVAEALPPRPARRTVVRLWLPLTPILLLLSPVPLLLAPLAWLAPAPFRPARPYSAALAVGRVLMSLSGTVVHVDTPDCLVSIRIF